ncbi:type II toxin-antitoxin system HigA family antitoxin [Pontiella sp.]|uniref:helix-turn-helix domain-containing protein n=1 Tax=Pontiella sp. TaxID=2837462 RepID=UPI00356416D6
MKITLIKTEAQNEEALARIEELMALEETPAVNDELELLATLVALYEEAAYPLAAPDPIAAIRFRMEQQKLKQKDLIPYIGSKSKVSEVLSGKRSLSISMIRNLHEGLDIPLEVLLGESADPPALVAEKRSTYGRA